MITTKASVAKLFRRSVICLLLILIGCFMVACTVTLPLLENTPVVQPQASIGIFEVAQLKTDEQPYERVIEQPFQSVIMSDTFYTENYASLTNALHGDEKLEYAVVQGLDRKWRLFSAAPLPAGFQAEQARAGSYSFTGGLLLTAWSLPFPISSALLFDPAVATPTAPSLEEGISAITATLEITDLDDLVTKFLVLSRQESGQTVYTLVIYELVDPELGNLPPGEDFDPHKYCAECNQCSWICSWF